MKTCTQCGQEKPVEKYYARRSVCRSCHNKNVTEDQRNRRRNGPSRANNLAGSLPDFRQRTDPLVLQAMRKSFDHQCQERRCSRLSPAERAVLEGWIGTRTSFMARSLSEQYREHEPTLQVVDAGRGATLSTTDARLFAGVR